MLKWFDNFFSKNRQFIPLMSTALLALVAYAIGAYFFVGMRNPQVFFNLFRNSAHLLISGIGMTLVILTGGIDLSVSGVVALTTVSSAVLLRDGWNPWVVFLLMLMMGMSLGAIMGSFINLPESPAIHCNARRHVVRLFSWLHLPILLQNDIGDVPLASSKRFCDAYLPFTSSVTPPYLCNLI